MPGEVPSDSTANLTALFYHWLTEAHGNLTYWCSVLLQQIEEQNLAEVYGALDAVDDQVRVMRNISIVFDGYLHKHKQLVKSLNQNPKEGV